MIARLFNRIARALDRAATRRIQRRRR